MQEDFKYAGAAGLLSDRVRPVLLRVLPTLQAEITEIRLRAEKPLGLMTPMQALFLREDGQVTETPNERSFALTRADMQDCFVSICGWAVHSHQQELANGYIAVKGGHRAGVAATAVTDGDKVVSVRDITSINLRVAREIFGAADTLLRDCMCERLGGILLIGAPASGKTTLLRDLARQLSSGKTGRFVKVCVVDESGEIGASSGGVVQNDLGSCCDLLSGFPKAKGLEIAVRYLSPQVIVCDEICNEREVAAVAQAANSGVAVVTSIHAASYEEFLRKPQAKRLLETGAFAYLAVLAGADAPSKIKSIKRMDELC